MPCQHNRNIRKAVLRDYSRNESKGKLAAKYHVNSASVVAWAKAAGVGKGTYISDDELDKRLDKWAEEEREKVRQLHEPGSKKFLTGMLRVDKLYGKETDPVEPGPVNPKAGGTTLAAMLAENNGMTAADFQKFVEARFEQIAAQLQTETSIEGQVNCVVAGNLLTSLAGAAAAPLTISTWADMEKCVKLLRLTLGMDAEGKTSSNGPNLAALNQPVKGRVVDTK